MCPASDVIAQHTAQRNLDATSCTASKQAGLNPECSHSRNNSAARQPATRSSRSHNELPRNTDQVPLLHQKQDPDARCSWWDNGTRAVFPCHTSTRTDKRALHASLSEASGSFDIDLAGHAALTSAANRKMLRSVYCIESYRAGADSFDLSDADECGTLTRL